MTMQLNRNQPLKLDFNERADKLPPWLDVSSLSATNLWRYPDQSRLLNLMSEQLSLPAEQILLTNGGDEAIELLFKVATLEQKQLVIPLPAFSQYLAGLSIWGSKAKTIAAKPDLTIDLEASIEALDNNSILVLTSPNNPTGETLSLAVLRDVCQRADAVGAEVFLDQAYIEFSGQAKDSLKLLEEFDNLLLLRTLSKAYGLAAIRCGYLLGSDTMVQRFRQRKMPFNIPQPTLDLAEQAFSSSALAEVTDYCQQIASNRELITQLLRDSGLQLVESEANFVLVIGDKARLQLIEAACQLSNIQIKTSLVGLELAEQAAIRIGIPYQVERLLTALKLALQPQLLCFDMDGVLIDTAPSYDQAIKQTVAVYCGEQPDQSALDELRSRGGFNNDWVLTYELIKQQLGEQQLPGYTDVVAQFQDLYLGNEQRAGLNQFEQPLLNDGLRNRLFVKNSRRLKTAVVTGRPRAEAELGLSLLGIKNTVLISDDDVGASKPDPEGICQCMNFYQASLCWMVGDTPDDMQAAAAAGALAIGIAKPGQETNLYQAGAALVLTSINDLEKLL